MLKYIDKNKIFKNFPLSNTLHNLVGLIIFIIFVLSSIKLFYYLITKLTSINIFVLCFRHGILCILSDLCVHFTNIPTSYIKNSQKGFCKANFYNFLLLNDLNYSMSACLWAQLFILIYI